MRKIIPLVVAGGILASCLILISCSSFRDSRVARLTCHPVSGSRSSLYIYKRTNGVEKLVFGTDNCDVGFLGETAHVSPGWYKVIYVPSRDYCPRISKIEEEICHGEFWVKLEAGPRKYFYHRMSAQDPSVKIPWYTWEVSPEIYCRLKKYEGHYDIAIGSNMGHQEFLSPVCKIFKK